MVVLHLSPRIKKVQLFYWIRFPFRFHSSFASQPYLVDEDAFRSCDPSGGKLIVTEGSETDMVVPAQFLKLGTNYIIGKPNVLPSYKYIVHIISGKYHVKCISHVI